jgi:hypothetical protein
MYYRLEIDDIAKNINRAFFASGIEDVHFTGGGGRGEEGGICKKCCDTIRSAL